LNYILQIKNLLSLHLRLHLEKAFDRVLREVITLAMRKMGVEEWFVSAVMSTYTGAKNSCKNGLWKQTVFFLLFNCCIVLLL